MALPGSELCAGLERLRCDIDSLEAEFSRRVSVLDRTQAYMEGGYLNAASWLFHRCNFAQSTAWDRVKTARKLSSEFAATAKAFAHGAISHLHASLICRTVEKVGLEAAQKAEPDLLEAAIQLDPFRLRKVTQVLEHCYNPDGTLSDSERARERRHLYLSDSLDGMFYLNGVLDPEGGALVRTALNGLMGPPHAGDMRSPPQRRADALVELAQRTLDAGELPTTGCERPHLLLTADIQTLRGDPECGPGRLEWDELIHCESVRRLACDCSLTPIVTDQDGNPLAAGRKTRVVPPSMRRALHVRDKHCQFPGCDRPARWTDAHHLWHWVFGGPTILTNCVLLCRRHHLMVHEGGWELVRKPGSGWDVVRREAAARAP
jgi:hypothetical protein